MFIVVSFIIAQTIITTTHMCINRGMDKQIVKNKYSGILFSSKKENNYQMNLRIIMWRSKRYQMEEERVMKEIRNLLVRMRCSWSWLSWAFIYMYWNWSDYLVQYVKLTVCQLYLNEDTKNSKKHYTFLHFSSLHGYSPW